MYQEIRRARFEDTLDASGIKRRGHNRFKRQVFKFMGGPCLPPKMTLNKEALIRKGAALFHGKIRGIRNKNLTTNKSSVIFAPLKTVTSLEYWKFQGNDAGTSFFRE